MSLTYNPRNNNLLEIFITCFIMGITLTISIITLLLGTSSLSNKYIWLIIYSLLLHGFFILEFINSSLYQYNSVTSKSFLIYGNKGNKQFWYLQLLTIWEYLLLRLGKLNVIVKYFPNIGNWLELVLELVVVDNFTSIWITYQFIGIIYSSFSYENLWIII